MSTPLQERLAFDSDRDLAKLIDAYQQEKVIRVDTGLAEHFAVARAKEDRFVNHPPVLAMSIGGSNTKLMLARMEQGRVIASRVRTQPNPPVLTDWREYFDTLLMEDPVIRGYLAEDPNARIGLSLAVPIADGVPWHPNKIGTISGLVARSLEGDVSSFHLKRNLKEYFAQRNLPDIPVHYQGDAVIAHLGGVALTPLGPDEQTMLLVCGTGMACADEGNFVLVATTAIVDGDGELYDLDQMEGGQYQYLFAGKGLFGMMRRAIALELLDAGSVLRNLDLDMYFASVADSRTVVELWESSLPGAGPVGKAAEIRRRISPQAFERLTWIATQLVQRGIGVLSNCTLSTASWLGPAPDGQGARLFVEGSMALHEPIISRVMADVRRRCRRSPVFDEKGVHRPLPPRPQLDALKVYPEEGVSQDEVAKADLTTVGALAMGIAEALLGR